MTRILKQLIVISLIFSALNLSAQNGILIIVGQVKSIKFDTIALRQQQLKDRMEFATTVWKHDTLIDCTEFSVGPDHYMRFSNPYIITVEIHESFSKSLNQQKIQARIWKHENPEEILKKRVPMAFILLEKDSLGVYPLSDCYRVFKTWTGQYAEPVSVGKKIYPKAKKAFFKYALLKEFETVYYQLISDEQHCCIDQLQELYGIK